MSRHVVRSGRSFKSIWLNHYHLQGAFGYWMRLGRVNDCVPSHKWSCPSHLYSRKFSFPSCTVVQIFHIGDRCRGQPLVCWHFSQCQGCTYWIYLRTRGNYAEFFYAVRRLKMWWLLAFRKKCIAGFVSAEKMHYGIDEIFLLRDPLWNCSVLHVAFGWLHPKLDARIASNIRKCPQSTTSSLRCKF